MSMAWRHSRCLRPKAGILESLYPPHMGRCGIRWVSEMMTFGRKESNHVEENAKIKLLFGSDVHFDWTSCLQGWPRQSGRIPAADHHRTQIRSPADTRSDLYPRRFSLRGYRVQRWAP